VSTTDTVESGVPRVPVGDWIESVFEWVDDNLGGVFDFIAETTEASVNGLTELLQAPPALLSVAVAAGLAWLVRDWKLALLSAVSLLFVVSMDQWDNAMETLSLVLVATVIALVVGIPLGIAAARWDRVSKATRPAMDLMQTMPAFVWLVPVVTLFSIGVEAGLVATVIFAIPPGVRLTELGIRQVDKEVVEAGHAFGGTPRQILRGIQMPLAMPTVMAGVNQVIMLALSMAVIAGLVGGGGLGSEVTTSISRLDVGLGFEAGLSVVVLAIYLDRITAAVGSGSRPRGRGLGALMRRSGSERTDQASQEAPAQPAGVG
jgi:glycine betaine/proline transport system permease protein